MSNFWPWGFKMGQPSGPGIPASGCPLNDHPLWERVVGAGDSVFCWENHLGTSISVHGSEDIVKNLSYKGLFVVNGMVSAKIAYVASGDQNWFMPLAGRMINGSNIIGARWNDGQFEVVQRKNGTWATLFAGGPAPVIGDEVKFSLSSKYWKLVVNDVVVGEGTTGLPDDPGYWGISQHRSGNFDGQTFMTDFAISDATLAKTPCMTANDAPYGECSASSGADAWKGMDCVNTDAWVSDDVPMPQWIQWLGSAGQPSMVPDRLHMEGSSTDHSPKKMTLQGTNDGGQTWEDIQTWDNLDFGNTPIWDTSVTGSTAYLGIRLQIDEIRAASQCEIGTFTVYGHAGGAPTIPDNAIIIGDQPLLIGDQPIIIEP